MRLKGLFLLLSLGAFTAYYIYEPIPEDIEERWKLMLTNCLFRSLSHLVRTQLHLEPASHCIRRTIFRITVSNSRHMVLSKTCLCFMITVFLMTLHLRTISIGYFVKPA